MELNPYEETMQSREERQREQSPYLYGTPYKKDQLGSLDPWERGMAQGLSTGRTLFYDDQDMKDSRARLEDLSKGYDGKTLGALRESAREQIAGQRGGYMNQLRSNLAKQGVGGARAAAMAGAADQRFAQTGAEAERKLTADNAGLISKGTQNLTDYLMKQKMGQLTTGVGYGQMASAKYAADRGAELANKKEPGFLDRLGLGGDGLMNNPLLAAYSPGTYLTNQIVTGGSDANRYAANPYAAAVSDLGERLGFSW